MISYKMARRSFIRGCGGSAALLLPWLRGAEARAQGIAAPLRFLVIHHPLGSHEGMATWRPNVPATTTTYTLPVESAPFAPLQSKMVMIDGVNLVTASKVAGNNGGSNTHEGGMVALMTGVPTLGQIGQQDHVAGGASIDQLFLDNSTVLGGAASSVKTSFPSLQLAADIRSDRNEIGPRVLSYRPPTTLTPPTTDAAKQAARQPLFSESQPLNVFNTMFARMVVPTGTNTAALLAQKKSILDFMTANLARMRTLVPAAERAKLDVHAVAIQNLESSIRQSLAVAPGAGSVCVTPTMPTMFNQGGAGTVSNGIVNTLTGVDYPNHQTVGRAHLSLIKAAFACDYTRVASFMWSAGTNWVQFPTTFNGSTIPNQSGAMTAHHPPSHTQDAATEAWLDKINIFYSQQTSAALQEFDAAMSDVDGNSILDNTVVVYVTEVSVAWNHNFTNMPLLVFGGKNTRLRGGTFLKVTGGQLPVQGATGAPSGSGNRPFNDVWMALAPIFNVNLPALGNQGTQYTGALPGLIT